MCDQLVPIMKEELLKQQFQIKIDAQNEVRVYKEKSGIVKDKRLQTIFDYDEVLHGKALDDIIDQIVKLI